MTFHPIEAFVNDPDCPPFIKDAVAPLKIQIGAGAKPLAGFVNVEPRATTQPNYHRGHAFDLSFAPDDSVDVVFANAVFEHLYVCQIGLAIREWLRVLKPAGVAVMLGIPDFETICRLYLDKAPGITQPTFDIFEAYRYTHGFPEAMIDPRIWPQWSPSEHLNDAPMGWLPQLHKAVFDAELLKQLFTAGGFETVKVLRYAWPGETHKLNLGVVTGTYGALADFEEYIDLTSAEHLC